MVNYTSFPLEKQKELRSLRYKRQSISRELAIKHTGHSVQKCMWSTHGSVSINYSQKDKKAFYKGLITCGSVWDCPVCSAKIMARRSEELEEGLKTWFEGGHAVCMVTYTIRHNYDDKLKYLAQVLTDGIRFVQSGAPWIRIKNKVGIKGSVISTEPLFNLVNGWHIHKHQILFLESANIDKKLLSKWIYARYESFIESKGYDSLEGVGVDISDVTTDRGVLPQYLTKMTAELTASDTKNNKGISPFELLDNSELNYKFVEYSKAMYGKRKLVWSRGMKKLLGLNDIKTDEEIAAEDDLKREGVEEIRKIDIEDWRYIRKNKLVVECLEKAEQGGTVFERWYFNQITVNVWYERHKGHDNPPPRPHENQ